MTHEAVQGSALPVSSLTAHQHDKGADAPGVNKSQLVVTTGVAIASYGEINFVVIGVVLQLISVLTESTRLTMVQILLQVRTASPHLPTCFIRVTGIFNHAIYLSLTRLYYCYDYNHYIVATCWDTPQALWSPQDTRLLPGHSMLAVCLSPMRQCPESEHMHMKRNIP